MKRLPGRNALGLITTSAIVNRIKKGIGRKMAPKSNSSDNSGDDNDDLVINVDKENNAPIQRPQPSLMPINNMRNLIQPGYFQHQLTLPSKGKINLSPNKPKLKGKKKRKRKMMKSFNCTHESCTKVLNDKSSLRKHLLTHSKRRYECPFEKCHKKFIDRSKLKRHLLVHSGNKQFTCPICQKTFSLDFNLKTHQRIHTGDKPYSCTYPGCFKKFAQSSNLAAHKKIHEADRSSNTIDTLKSELLREYNLSSLLNDLETNPFMGSFNIHNLIHLNKKYENTQLQQYQKGNLKQSQQPSSFSNLFKRLKKESRSMKKIFHINKEQRKGHRIKAVTIVYNENCDSPHKDTEK